MLTVAEQPILHGLSHDSGWPAGIQLTQLCSGTSWGGAEKACKCCEKQDRKNICVRVCIYIYIYIIGLGASYLYYNSIEDPLPSDLYKILHSAD